MTDIEGKRWTMDLQDRQAVTQAVSHSMLCFPSDGEKADGSRRVSPGNRFLPELEWLPRREAPVVTRCRTLTALSTCLTVKRRAPTQNPKK